MKDNTKAQSENSFLFFLRLLLSNWKLLLSTYAFIGVVTVIVLLVIPKWYKSEATIVILDEKGSQLNSMLSEFSTLGFGLDGALSVETYIGYVHTKKMYDRIINTFDLMNVYDLKFREDAYEKIFKYLGARDNENNTFTISFIYEENPEKARDIVLFVVNELDRISLEVDKAQASNFKEYIEGYYLQTKDQLAADEDSLARFQKTSGILNIEVQMEATLQGIAELELQRSRLEIERDFLQKSFQNSSKVSDLNNQIETVSEKIDDLTKKQSTALISLKNAPENNIEFLRLRRNITVGTEITEFLRLQYEQANLDEQKISSNLYMVDPPLIAGKKYKPQRMRTLIIVMFFTVLLSLVYIRLEEFYRVNKTQILSTLNSDD